MSVDYYVHILRNKKVGHFGKRKTYNSARERTRKLHTSEYTISCAKKKRKFFFIQMKVQLITVSSAIPYISEINSTRSSLKKKRGKRKKIVRTRRGRRRKRRRKGEGKRGRESEKERKRD